jgi:hypothetical protein
VKPYSAPAISTLRPVVYGFIDVAPVLCAEGTLWRRAVQRPFRGHWLWLWGDGELESLSCAGEAQLAAPMPFAYMQRAVLPEQFLRFIEPAPDQLLGSGSDLEARPCSPEILTGFGCEALQLPSMQVGSELAFRFRGLVRGVVLVGVEIP